MESQATDFTQTLYQVPSAIASCSACAPQLHSHGYTVLHADSPYFLALKEKITPSAFECDETCVRDSMEHILLLLKDMGLRPVQYVDEGDGGLFVNICPTVKDQKSCRDLRGHTDGAFLYMPGEILPGWMPIPRYIVLYCVKNSAVYTRIAHTQKLATLLHADHLEILCGENFRILPQATWNIKTDDAFLAWRPLIKQHKDDFYIRYSHSNVVSKNTVAENVRKTLEHAVAKSYDDVLLEPDNILIIDNLKTVHGRRGLAGNAQLEDRWLIRFYCN